MKTSNYHGVRRIPFVLGIVLLSLLFSDCTCENRKKDPEVKRNDPIKAPAAFAFIDANVVNNSYVPNVTVTLIDPDSLVRTSSGTSFTELILKNGVMNLGLHYQATVNEKEPYRYRIKAEAPGYVTTMETVLLTDEEPGYFPVFMVELKNPPPGIGKVTTSLPVNGNGYITSDIDFETTGGSDEQPRFTFTIPKGTQLLSNCKGVTNAKGNTRIQLTSSDPMAPNIGRTFPNGFLVTDAIDQNGEVIATPSNPSLFASAGWISATIQVGDQEIDGFSNPVEGTMTIDSKLINAETQKEFQAGDTIPIWSLDEDTGNWQLEEEAIVQENSGELMVKFAMNHLSTWNVDQMVEKCPTPIAISIYNPSGARDLYVEIVKDQTGEDMITGARDLNWTHFNANETTHDEIVNFPRYIDMAVVIYSTNPPRPSSLLKRSEVIRDCNSPQISTINLPGIDDSAVCTNFKVQLNFDDGGGTVESICNNSIWYREAPGTDLSPWESLGVLINGELTTHKFYNPAAEYEFMIWYSDDPDSVPDSEIDSKVIMFRLNEFNPINPEDTSGSGTYNLTPLPIGDGNFTTGSMTRQCFRTASANHTNSQCKKCMDDDAASELAVLITLNGVKLSKITTSLCP